MVMDIEDGNGLVMVEDMAVILEIITIDIHNHYTIIHIMIPIHGIAILIHIIGFIKFNFV
jgi:hypothetical protein